MKRKYLDEALRLVALGYAVFPCEPNRKLPFAAKAPKGCNSASRDPEIVKAWWTECPGCNIGLKCENILVIDVDRKGGMDGTKDIADVTRVLGPLPPSPRSVTPGGGFHLFFQRPDADIVGKTHVLWKGKATGIDIRVGNQYIVAPPSFRDDVPVPGEEEKFTTGFYVWKTPVVPSSKLPVLPDAWIDGFLPHRNAKKQPLILPPAPKLILPTGTYTPIDRCRLYLDKVAPSISGQGGDTQLFKAACIIFWDFGLSETEGMPLLHEFNTRCDPPWDKDRLTYKMNQALTSPHDQPRGFKLAEEREPQNFGVDLSNFMVHTVPKTVRQTEPMPEKLLYVPGFVYDVSRFTLSGAPHPNPQMATLGALACQSFLASRKVRSAATSRPSVYLLALAGSGTGKDYPRLVNQYILARIGMETHILDNCASGEGLEDRIIIKQVLLMQTDEFNFMLTDFAKGIESRFRTLESVILRLYSAVRGSYTGRVKAGKEQPLSVQQPGLVIFGTATPERFKRALTIDMIEGGLASRCIVVESDERSRGQKSREVDEMPDDILEVAQWWRDFVPVNQATGKKNNLGVAYPTLHVIPLTPEAEAVMNDFENHADDQNIKFAHKNQVAAILWTRVHEAAGRLAVLYACSKNHLDPLIDKEAAIWACDFALWTCEQLNLMVARHVAENAFHAIWLRIEETIRKNGGHASKSLLINKLKISSKQLQEAVEAMGIGERIRLVEIPTGGRTRIEYALLDRSAEESSDDFHSV